MAAPVRFLSGRQQQQKIGIEGSTQDEKVLEVVGRVGIGTTIFEPSKQLDVRGDVIVSGELTVGDTTFGTDITTRNLSASGIATLGTVEVSSGIITAVSGVVTYYGDGSQLTNLPSSGLNEIQEEGSVVGSSIESLNFVGNNITVSAAGTASTITSSDTPTFDTLAVSGVSTFTGAIDANGSLDVDGHTELDDVNVSGAITATTFTGNLAGTVNTAAQPNITSLGTLSSLTVSGVSTFTGAIDANGNLDVDGHTELDDVNVSGAITATTFTGNLAGTVNTATQPNITSVGTLTELEVTGITSSSAFADFDYLQAPFGSTVTFTVTVASKDSSHRYNGTGSGFGYSINGVQAPFLTLTPGRTYRFTNDNTGSHPLKFYLEADKTTEYTSGVSFQNTYTEIVVSDQTPTVLHYQCTAHNYMGNAIQVNSNVVNTNYTATLRGGLDVTGVSTFAGAADFNGNVDIDGHTELDNLNVSGVSTFVGLVTVTTGDVHIANRLFVGGLEVEGSGSENTFTGINTFTNLLDNTLGNPDTGSLNVNGGFGVNKNASFGSTVFVQNAIGIGSAAPIGKLDVNGHTELDDVNVSGVSTFTGTIDANGSLDVDGHTELDEVNVSGVTTFNSNVNFGNGSTLGPSAFNVNTPATVDSLTVESSLTVNSNVDADFNGGLNVAGVSTFQNHVHLGDSDELRLGDGDDLQIRHNGSNSVISNSTGDLIILDESKVKVRTNEFIIKSGDDSENLIRADKNGEVKLYYDNSQKFETTGIGVSIINGTSDTATITGPSNLVIDPAAVGDNTGAVRIKGDLFVDGTQTQINSTTIELADFIVGIASTATTDTLADGAGIQIGPDNTFLYEYNGGTNPSLKSSENLNVASGKGYQINQTEVLSATTLGSSVVNSSLTSVGTLGSLTVSGNITANGNIVGDNSTNITGIDGVTATTLTGTPANTNSNSAFSVTANGASAYRFTGPGNSGSDDNPDLYLVRGQRYTFANNSGGSHPFQIRVASGGSAYNDGVTNNGASSGNIVFNVQHDAPARLYYQCTSHSGMVGTIYIVGGPQIISGIVTATTFSGSGASLTALNASNLASGTIPDGRFPATLPAISGANLTNLPAATTIPVADESSDTTCFPIFTTAATGSLALKSGSNLTFNSANGTLTATAFSGDGSALTNLSGVLDSVASDTSPQLGANLDLNSNLINGTGGINITGIITATTFSGSGASLDTLNASNLASGTIPDGRFPATLPAISGANLTNLPAGDAATLDGVDSTSFLRSDAADIKTSGNLTFNDGVKARFGTGADLNIYHEGTHSYVKNNTGNLILDTDANDSDVVIKTDNGSGGTTVYFRADGSAGESILYHYGTQKLATKSGGVTVTGTVTATAFSGDGSALTGITASQVGAIGSLVGDTSPQLGGTLDTNGNLIQFGDSSSATDDRLQFGASQDLQIYHSGSASHITDSGTGDLIIQGNNLRLTGSSGNMLYATDGAETSLYYGGSVKLYTKNDGVAVSGELNSDSLDVDGAAHIAGDLTLEDTDAGSAAGPELKLFRNSASPADADYLGQIKFAGESDTGTERNYAKITGKISDASNGTEDGILEFAHIKAGSQNISGRWTSTELQLLNGTHFSLGDSQEIRVGASDDLLIYHNGSDSYIYNSTGDILIRQDTNDGDIRIQSDNGSGGLTDYFRADGSAGEAILYHYGTQKLATKSGGVTVTGTLTATTFSGSGASLTAVDAATLDGVDSTSFLRSDAADIKTSGNLTFYDGIKARFGTNGELNVYHESNYSYILNSTVGDIIIRNEVDDADTVIQGDDGSGGNTPYFRADGSTGEAMLYHYGTEKLATKSGGVTVTGTLTATTFSGSGASLTNVDAATLDGVDSTSFLRSDAADIKTSGNLTFNDNVQARFGSSGDLLIFHNGNSYISNTSTGGNLVLQSYIDSDVVIRADNSSGGFGLADYVRADGSTGEAILYHYGTQKLATKSGGVTVTGTLTATAFSGDGSALTNLPAGATPDKISEGNTEVEVIDTGSDGHVKFTTEGSERARIDANGRLGIGTTNPGSTLEINVGTATSALDIQGSAGQLFSVTNNLTSGSIFSVNDVSGIPSIDVDADGTIQLAPFGTTEMVGIGTTNPTSKLHVVGDARVTGVITATSFSGSGANLTGISFDLVNDTTPQLGGTLDTNGNLIQFGDSSGATDDRLQFGASQDLSIYHDGSNSYIVDSGTGNLIINATDLSFKNSANNATLFTATDGGAVTLYHNNVYKFQTKSDGVNVVGELECDSLDVDGVANFSGGDITFTGASYNVVFDVSDNALEFNDNAKATFGAAGDLEIFHDGSNSYIDDIGTGKLRIRGGEVAIQKPATSENMLRAIEDGAVELYYDNSKKLETTASGIDVTGEVQCDSLDVDGAADITGNVTLHANLDLQDNDKILIGTGDDLEIYHDGTNNIIKTAGNQNLQLYSLGTGAVEIASDAPKLIFNDATGGSQIDFSINANTGVFTMEDDTNSDTFFKYTQNGAVELYHNNSKKLETTAAGAIVTGILSATSFAGDGSALTGIEAGGSPEFYTGITSSTQITPLSFETSVFTFPSTSGRQYVIESINVANVDESVGVGTTVNIIASIQDATAAEQTYIAYNVPIVTGGLIELLKNPIVAGPSDVIKMWTTNDDYVGVNNAADVYINYTEFESTDYISKFASSTTINSSSAVTLYTSTGNPTMIEKIGFANRTDTGDFPVSIKITNGVTTSYLAKNLIIPRYSTVDILDRHKRIETGAKIEVEVGSTGTIDVIISGKKITS